MSERPTVAHDFPAEAFPIHIHALAAGTVRVVWQASLIDPPGVLEVPGRDVLGEPVDMIVHFADGSVSFAEAPPE